MGFKDLSLNVVDGHVILKTFLSELRDDGSFTNVSCAKYCHSTAHGAPGRAAPGDETSECGSQRSHSVSLTVCGKFELYTYYYTLYE